MSSTTIARGFWKNIKNKACAEQFVSWDTISAPGSEPYGEDCLPVKAFPFFPAKAVRKPVSLVTLATLAMHLQALGAFSFPPHLPWCCNPFSWCLWIALQPACKRLKAMWKHNPSCNCWTRFIWAHMASWAHFEIQTENRACADGVLCNAGAPRPQLFWGAASQQGCRAARKVPAEAIPSSGRWRKRIPPTCAELERWRLKR